MSRTLSPVRIREGEYANYFEVGHKPFEFYFDFGQYDPRNLSGHLAPRS
jgi:hypothetical protein